MRLRRPVLISCVALVAFLSCGHPPKTFDAVTVRGPMQPIIQPVNAVAAADAAVLLLDQQLAFIVGAIRAVEPEREQPLSVTSPTPALVTVAPTTSALPPEWVCQRESHCTYGINTGNGYFGKWQFALSWGGKLGLPADITQATPAQEDEAARQLWDSGRGCSNWSGPNWSACN